MKMEIILFNISEQTKKNTYRLLQNESKDNVLENNSFCNSMS